MVILSASLTGTVRRLSADTFAGSAESHFIQ